jgi:ABC-2 type transport system permease protein
LRIGRAAKIGVGSENRLRTLVIARQSFGEASAAARSEWIKLRTVRSTIWALVLTVIFAIGLGALFTAIEVAHWASRTPAEISGFDPLLYSFAGLNLAQLSVGVLGVLVMTSEYSTATIKLTLGATPQRSVLLAAKAATFSAAAAALIAAGLALTRRDA